MVVGPSPRMHTSTQLLRTCALLPLGYDMDGPSTPHQHPVVQLAHCVALVWFLCGCHMPCTSPSVKSQLTRMDPCLFVCPSIHVSRAKLAHSYWTLPSRYYAPAPRALLHHVSDLLALIRLHVLTRLCHLCRHTVVSLGTKIPCPSH